MKIRVQCGRMCKVAVVRRLGCSIDATVLQFRCIYLFNDDIFNDPVNVPNGKIVNELTERGVAV
jgi:hypothetical protein